MKLGNLNFNIVDGSIKDEFICEWTENIFHDFSYMLDIVKKNPTFSGINDEVIIMKSLLKFYQEIRESEVLQLKFFYDITIPKKVANEMTDILILLLRDKLEMLEVDLTGFKTSANIINIDKYKIEWLATQQEFVELIIELSTKKYIAFPDITLPKKATLLTEFFDFNSSQRKKNSNVANNILKHLKHTFDSDLKGSIYFFEKPAYKRKFDGISKA